MEMKQCTCLFGFPSPEVISSEIRAIPKGFIFLHAHVFNVTTYMYMHPKIYSNVSCILKYIYKWWHIVLILLQSAFFTQHFVFENYPC